MNPEHVGYLNDITGNRRYWITKFHGPVDLIGLENNADQLWAEALSCYKQEPLYLKGEAELMQALEAQARMPEDPLKSSVMKWVRDNNEVDVVATNEILEWMGVPMKNINRADQSRVAQSLVEIGWAKEVSREGGMWNTQFRRPQREILEREARKVAGL